MMARLQLSRRTAMIGAGALVMGFVRPSQAVELKPGETGDVDSVSSGHVFKLTSGLTVRLAGISAPNRDQPGGPAARKALEAMLSGATVRLSYGGDPRDRYERALAQVHRLDEDGQPVLWVQGDMVEKGSARVHTWPEELIDSDQLYALEKDARAMKRGLWAYEDYAVRSPDPNSLAQNVDSFQLVEGIVTSTTDIRGRVYLNFGADYRTDFTVVIAKKHRKRFNSFDPVGLEGARIRVRGWIELFNGPMIWANHPGCIEILS